MMQTRKLTKKTLVILLSSLLAITLSAGISFAQTDKLVVEDGASNPVFSVNDAGEIRGKTSAEISGDTFQLFSMLPYSDTGWEGGFFNVRRAKGTEIAPLAVTGNNTIFTFDAMGYDGTDYARGGQIIGKVDPAGGVAAGKVPFYWAFRTMGNDGVLGDRMTISADGNVTVLDLAGSGNAYACVDSTGKIYRSATACN